MSKHLRVGKTEGTTKEEGQKPGYNGASESRGRIGLKDEGMIIRVFWVGS